MHIIPVQTQGSVEFEEDLKVEKFFFQLIA